MADMPPRQSQTVRDPDCIDKQLMQMIRDGNADALQNLMERYWGRLLRYAARMLSSGDEAEDVAQEVFVRVWEHRSRWTPSGSVQGYLYRIARNEVLLRARHQDVRSRSHHEIQRRAGRVTTPFEATVHQELHAALEEAIQALPKRRREAFLLVRLHGLSLNEAADILGVSRQTVANHVYLAITDLKSLLHSFVA